MKIAYPYVRVSTNKQENGPEVQKEKLANYYNRVLARDGFAWADFYQDVVTGSKALDRREAGGAICQRAKEGDIILVTKFDRAFRSSRDFHNQIHHWRQKGCRFIVTDHDVDCTTPNGYFVATLLVAQAQLEREHTAERTREALAHRKAHGRVYNHDAPRGLKNGKNGYLEVDHDFEPKIKALLHFRDVEKLTWKQIAVAMTNRERAMLGEPPIKSVVHPDCWSKRIVEMWYREAKQKETARQRTLSATGQ